MPFYYAKACMWRKQEANIITLSAGERSNYRMIVPTLYNSITQQKENMEEYFEEYN